MFALLRRLAGSCLLLRALVSPAGRLGSRVLIGRGAARDVGGLVLLTSSSPLVTTFRLFGFIPIGVGLVLGSASEPFVFIRIPILHPLQVTAPTSGSCAAYRVWAARRGMGAAGGGRSPIWSPRP